ncbi:hypothetical protein DFH28DRAFT_922893 [Melampsora americana]|nr:hypothetical protein DFH28DRAFT_922893 [Melampsora americana]
MTLSSVLYDTGMSSTDQELGSGTSLPIGFKNGTQGNLKVAIDAIRPDVCPCTFLLVNDDQGSGFDCQNNWKSGFTNIETGSICSSKFKSNRHEHFRVFKKLKFSTSAFTIAHCALGFEYKGEGFLENNKDSVSDEDLNLLFATQNTFLKDVSEQVLEIHHPPTVAATDTHKSVTFKSSAGAETVTSCGAF